MVLAADRRGLNPLRHGAFSKAPLLPWECPAEREQHVLDYRTSLRPRNQVETDLVDRAEHEVWLACRVDTVQGAMEVVVAQNACRNDRPADLIRMDESLEAAETELGLLAKLTKAVRGRIRRGERNPVAGSWFILDLLIQRRGSLLDMRQGELGPLLARQIKDRRGVLSRRRAELLRLEVQHRDAIGAAVVLAALLPPEVSSRLQRERTYHTNEARRALDTLQRLRADEARRTEGDQVEVRRLTAGLSAETNPSTGYREFLTTHGVASAKA